MGWIITGLANVCLELVNDLINWFMSIVLNLDLNIGYNPDKPIGSFFDLVYLGSNKVVGLFDQIFPYASYFIDVFLILAYCMVIIIAVYKLHHSIISDEGESPGRIAAGIFMGFGGVTFSYSFFIFAERIANNIYTLFRDVVISVNEDAGVGDKDDVFNMFSLINNDEMFANQDDMGFTSDLTMIIVMLVLFVALCFQLLRLVAEMFERYVVLGVLFYTCSLAFATLASKSTTTIFQKWIEMVASQFLLMFMNLFFLSVFSGSLNYIFAETADKGYVFKDDVEFITTMFMLIAWLTVAQKVDEHLRSLGMSVSQGGHSLGTAMMAGLMTARSIIHTATAPAKWAARKAGNAATGAAAGAIGSAVSGVIAKANSPSPAETVENARDGKGRFTPEGASAIMNKKGASVKGDDAMKAMAANGLDPKSDMFKYAKAPDGSMRNIFAGQNPDNISFGSGQITAKDEEGNIYAQLGKASDYETADGGAFRTIGTGDDAMIQAATPDIVAADSSHIMNELNRSGDYGSAAGVSWADNGNGTMTGTGKDGVTYQAAANYIATPNASSGPTWNGNAGSASYVVQKVNSGSTPGWAEVKPPSSQVILRSRSHSSAKPEASSVASRFMPDRNR